MIVAPPLDDGAVKGTVNLPVLAVTAPIVGAPAIVRGITVVAVDAAPEPAGFTARNLIAYIVPFLNAEDELEWIVITTGDVVLAGLNAFHVQPLVVEYS